MGAYWVLGLLLAVIHVEESFEGQTFPPPGWVVLDHGQPGYTWEVTDELARSGEHSAVVHYGPQGVQQNEWLVSPSIDLSGQAACYLVFWEDENYWQGYGDHHRIRVSTTSQTDTSTFVTILDMTPFNHTIQGFDGDPVVVDLSDYAGQTIYVAFQYTGDWADDWYLDDVTIFSPFDHDVMAESFMVPPSFYAPQNESFEPVVRVANIGLNTESFSVVLEVRDAQGTLVYLDSSLVSNLGSLQETDITLPPLTLGSTSPYTFTAYARLFGDQDPTNDTTTAEVYAWAGTRKPLLEMITNTGCPPCGPADEQLDQIVASLGDTLSVIRYHAWWPSPADPFYQANIPENTARINYYGADYTPHLWINGTLFDADADVSHWNQWIQDALAIPAPWALSVDGVFDPTVLNGEVYVTIQALSPSPYQNVYLRAAVIEDSIYYSAPNGSTWHHQTFRDMFPNTDGLPVSLQPGEMLAETLSFSIDSSWVWENCQVVLFLQDEDTKHVLNSDHVRLGSIVGVLEETHRSRKLILHMPSLVTTILRLSGTFPDPGVYKFSVYNPAGQRVWSGMEVLRRSSRVDLEIPTLQWAAGVYFLRLERGHRLLFRRRFVVLR